MVKEAMDKGLAVKMDEGVLDRIDAVPMSARMSGLKEKYLGEHARVDAAQLKLVLEAYQETEGEDIQLRRARVMKKIFENMPLGIHPGELTAGDQTRFFRGACPPIEWNAEFFKDPGVHKVEAGKHSVTLGSPKAAASIEDEELSVVQEAMAYFKGKTPAEAIRKALKDIWGDWYEDIMKVCASSRFETLPPLVGIIPRLGRVLNEGLRSVINEAKDNISNFEKSGDFDPDKLYMWQAVIIVCEGVISFANRYAKLAREMAATETDAQRRRDLEQLAMACERVPEHPARSFLEAVQSVRLISAAMRLEHRQSGSHLGRVDQYLYPFFIRDIKDKRITVEEAADIVGDLVTYAGRGEWIVEIGLKERVQSTQLTHLTLGGVDRDGKDACNELTYLFMHVQGLLRFPEPHSTLRWTPQTPERIIMKGIETNAKVGGNPMYVNDAHVIERLEHWGISPVEARDWGMRGCSQPLANPQGFTIAMHYCTPLALDLALHNGVASITGKYIGCETGDPRNFKTFDDLYAAFKKQFDFVYRRLLKAHTLVVRIEAKQWAVPFMSALEYHCVKNGKDFLRGGNGPALLDYKKDRGMVDTADSLMAMKNLVYDNKKVSLGDMLQALNSNFAGDRGEEIRQMCLAAPKYGNDVDEADYLLRDVAKFTSGVITSEKNAFGYNFTVNRNGLAWHYSAGKGTGALPNGRKAGTPFNDGSLSPMTGLDREGPTALLNSALKADYSESAVAILNMKFPLVFLKSQGASGKIASMVETFLKNGGTHIQFNFLDKQVLLNAKKYPEKYKDLVVRVAGYSAFFVTLTPEVQDEIIARTEQSM